MAKRVFFSFHYQDVIDFRANVVRNHWRLKPNRQDAGFFDASLWETTQKQGTMAIKRLINSGLEKTSVTCILIGSQTYSRKWVRYEIMKSFRRSNDMICVHINSVKDKFGNTKQKGYNPLSFLGVTYSDSGRTATLWEKNSNRWTKYSEIGGSASYQINPVPQQYRGKGYNFSKWYSVFDWVTDDGFNNFSEWVG